MTVIYVTPLKNDNISKCFFHFFQNFDFLGCWGVKGEKAFQSDKTILSAALHISGMIHYMTVIYGIHL